MNEDFPIIRTSGNIFSTPVYANLVNSDRVGAQFFAFYTVALVVEQVDDAPMGPYAYKLRET